jgi:hypothetical protein
MLYVTNSHIEQRKKWTGSVGKQTTVKKKLAEKRRLVRTTRFFCPAELILTVSPCWDFVPQTCIYMKVSPVTLTILTNYSRV